MPYLGIDLGTTNSVAVIYNEKNDTAQPVLLDGMDEVMPSVVTFLGDEILVGHEAKSLAIIEPEHTIISVKRLMGSDDALNIGENFLKPEEISSYILKKLKQAAEEQAGEVFDEVVITHPAYFNDKQIFATKQAGLLAGFQDVYLLSEPLAAAIEYGHKKGYAQTLLVYDLGGGTFDACILKVSLSHSGQEVFQELADIGAINLGGDDFDNELIAIMKQNFEETNSLSIDSLDETELARAMQKLKMEAESAKKKLSAANSAQIRINPLIIKDGVPYNLSFELSREDFEAAIRKYVDRTREIILEALKRANLEADDISKVILTGGATLTPMVRRMVAGLLKEPYKATDPAKSVAIGAAIYNYLIHLPNSNVFINQIARQNLGTLAATPHSAGEKVLIPIIPLGSEIPTRISDNNFIAKGASAVVVPVYQWDTGAEDERQYIGAVKLTGLEHMAQLEITYALDNNNIFEVYIKDLATGKESFAEFDRSAETFEPEIQQTTNKHFNITFCIDTTGSMDTYINGVKERIIEFSRILKERRASFLLGLIGFGDLNEKEKPTIYKFTDDILKFQKQVHKIPRTYGGDIPESALDALETATVLAKTSRYLPDDSKNVFILITDAPPHIPTHSGKELADICNMLEENDITVYIAARKDKKSREAYEPLVAKDGKYYDLQDEFYDILDSIAENIAELVRI